MSTTPGPESSTEVPIVANVVAVGDSTTILKDEGRDYILLKKIPADSPGGNERFEKVAVVKASNPDQAVSRAAEQPGSSFLNTDGPTTLRVVPVRNFTEVTAEVETTTRVKLS